ncbi:MAG: mechanosensitive ion channel family protein [Planctomycetota bacterium]|jgi:small-conductance mechanosensitive channel
MNIIPSITLTDGLSSVPTHILQANILRDFYDKIPGLCAVAAIIAALWLANWFLLHRKRDLNEESRFPRRIAMILLVGLGLVLIIIALPVSDATQGDLFRLLGLLLTAAIALSSTTFIANVMAGLMLRAVRSFRPGDFVEVAEHFGRVSARGLFHTEIQTEDHNLTTLPNLYLISNPIIVVHASGTVVSATVSLGYDNQHSKIQPLLIKAAERAGLEDPFVQVTELGDFSVTYRAAGFLPEVKQILTARSNLREMMLDTLHGAGVEIVSPTFMNQRRIAEKERTVPDEKASSLKRSVAKDGVPEELIFDKAEKAEKIEKLKSAKDRLNAEIEELRTDLKKADEDQKASLERKIARREKRAEAVQEIIETYQEEPQTQPAPKRKKKKKKSSSK